MSLLSLLSSLPPLWCRYMMLLYASVYRCHPLPAITVCACICHDHSEPQISQLLGMVLSFGKPRAQEFPKPRAFADDWGEAILGLGVGQGVRWPKYIQMQNLQNLHNVLRCSQMFSDVLRISLNFDLWTLRCNLRNGAAKRPDSSLLHILVK